MTERESATKTSKSHSRSPSSFLPSAAGCASRAPANTANTAAEAASAPVMEERRPGKTLANDGTKRRPPRCARGASKGVNQGHSAELPSPRAPRAVPMEVDEPAPEQEPVLPVSRGPGDGPKTERCSPSHPFSAPRRRRSLQSCLCHRPDAPRGEKNEERPRRQRPRWGVRRGVKSAAAAAAKEGSALSQRTLVATRPEQPFACHGPGRRGWVPPGLRAVQEGPPERWSSARLERPR